jgi:diguanylate cyclase (GGDEF)-like protein
VDTREPPTLILLIDDNPDVHRLLGARLASDRYELLSAFSGEEGLDLAETHEPKLILLDIDLPGMDGFETLARLRECPPVRQAPVVVLSVSDDIDAKVRAFNEGASDYVTKPFDIRELRARIEAALRLARALAMLEQRAQIDGLTGLWNRTYFGEKLASEIAQADRTGDPMCLIMADLDHFKHINDTHGHQAGDMILRRFSAMLVGALRSYDVACRYGGEEFAIILPSSDREQAINVAERVRAAVEAAAWPDIPELCVTASFGVTDAGVARMIDVAAWIEAADRALYSAKQAGRNRVHTFDVKLGDGQQAPRLAA